MFDVSLYVLLQLWFDWDILPFLPRRDTMKQLNFYYRPTSLQIV